MSKHKFRLAWLVPILLWLALPVIPVQAHANLVNSNPTPGQAMPEFPASIELDFSEAVNDGNAQAKLYNTSGELVATGKIEMDMASPKVLRVVLPAQPDGVYSLAWQVQSAIDGHLTSGTIPFSVGLSSPKASLLPPPGTPDPATNLPAPWEVGLRWVSYIGLSFILGGALFAALVWKPVLQQQGADLLAPWDEILTSFLRRMIRIGIIGVPISLLGILLWQLIQAGSFNSESSLLTELSHTLGHGSDLLLFRLVGFPLLLFLLANHLPPAGKASRPWWEIVALALALMLTYSLSGHNATLGEPLPVIGDWLHIAAMGAWLGGLLPMAYLMLRERREKAEAVVPLLAQVVRRFSRLALTCVIILSLTGFYSSLLQIENLQALFNTRYGQAVLLKIGLLLLLIGLGAINELGILPRMGQAGLPAFDWLSRTVRIEYAFGLLVLLAVGAVMSLPPGYEALQASFRLGFHQSYQADHVHMDLRIAPASVGENEFGVDITDQRPGADQIKPTILLRLQEQTSDSGINQVETQAVGNNRFTARGSYLSLMGSWQVEVILRKAGFNDVRHTFTVDLPKIATERGEKINPVPADARSLNDARTLYSSNCAPCHGASGRGDGPSGQALDPAPSDLVQHGTPGVHTDGQLFDWISQGYPGSAMPALSDTLTEQQRWDLVNYLRMLAKGQP